MSARSTLRLLRGYAVALLLIPAFLDASSALQKGTASVEGMVTSLDAGVPIAGATVELSPVGSSPEGVFRFGAWISKPGPHYTASTGANGKFLIADVPSGDYRLFATQALGFVLAEYGQRSTNGLGRPLNLAEGQKLRDVQLVMTPAGSISGRLLDRDGEPVVRAHVQAFKPSYSNGKRTLRVIQSVQTNDLGEYRLFWLPPGAYYIGARTGDPHAEEGQVLIAPPGAGGAFETASAMQSRRTVERGEVIEEALVPVYYPGAVEVQNASAVALRAGEHLGGIDFSTASGRIPSRHVRGFVIDERTNQPANGLVLLSPRESSSDFAVPSTRTGRNGFDIGGVLPGSYYLFAVGDGGMKLQTLEVSDRDVEDVRVFTGAQALATLQGSIAVESDTAGVAVDFTRIRVKVEREPSIAVLPPPPPPTPGSTPSGSVSAEGRFSLNSLPPGDYRVTVSGISQNLYLKSIRMGTSDLLADPLHVEKPPYGPVQIILSSRPGSLEGRILNERQQPAGIVTVALVPDPPRRARLDLYRNATTDDSGHFQIEGIAEGAYKVFAWEEVELTAWQNAEFLRPVEARGKAIRIEEGGRYEIETSVIGAQR